VTAGGGERRTEAGGWVAVWRLVHWSARIVEVSRRESAQPPLLRSEFVSAAPDLAEARERFPGLSLLWDAVRREYWAELITPQYYSIGTGYR
jgi:hypothetical protein